MLWTKFSHHMTFFHWLPAPHQHIMDFGKIYFEAQKSTYLHKMTLKPTVQNSWQYYLIKVHGSNSWHNISFLDHDLSSRISSEEIWESWFGGPSSVTLQQFKVNKRNMLLIGMSSNESVCNRSQLISFSYHITLKMIKLSIVLYLKLNVHHII